MATSICTTFNTFPHPQLFSRSFCKYFSPHNHLLFFSSSLHILPYQLSPLSLVKPPLNPLHPPPLCYLNDTSFTETLHFRNKNSNLASGYSLFDSNSKQNDRILKENGVRTNLGKRVGRKVEEINDGHESREFNGANDWKNGGRRRKKGSEVSSLSNSSSDRGRRRMEEILGGVVVNNSDHRKRGYNSESRTEKWSKDSNVAIVGNGNVHGKTSRDRDSGNRNESKVKKKDKMSKKSKVESPELQLRIGLDMCSKMGDLMGAIALYDSAVKQGVNIGQHQYTVLLYLCSSAAMGVVRQAKSGSGSRSLDKVSSQELDERNDFEEDEEDDDDMDEEDLGAKEQTERSEVNEIRVSDDVKKYALERGFEVYERMCLDKVQMNEAAMTSVARMAMAMGNGELAFDMVNQMKSIGISPKLRSYGPALSVFSSSGDVEKSFAVEEHMLENGIQPEEPELEALLRVSIEAGKADRVYYVLHKLRTNVRSVSPSAAELIEKWFKSREASRVGKRKWDDNMITRTMESVGGGWHGLGWLGRGKWSVSQTSVGADGLCKCCGEKMALIDLDPEETERFAESVASIAIKKEKNSSFQKFQRWLDYYGPFEAVVDAANVGLFSQRKFKPSKVNVVVNGIRQKLPSKKWPLIILHNKRVTGSKMELPINRAVVERWKNADALYATPTGSNDDWYWLYAAIKCKCLLVTNDEMRDHTFQLLGNDFFAKWKERHQVRFSFSEIGPEFHMPPPCSVVIQESGRGHWHIPLVSEHQSEGDRIWLCITRPKMLVGQHGSQDGINSGEDSEEEHEDQKQSRTLNPESHCQAKTPLVVHTKQNSEELISRGPRDVRNLHSATMSTNSSYVSVYKAIEAAEHIGGCRIDFQI